MNSDSGRRGGFNHTIIIDLLTCGVYNHIVSLLIIETSQADRWSRLKVIEMLYGIHTLLMLLNKSGY